MIFQHQLQQLKFTHNLTCIKAKSNRKKFKASSLKIKNKKYIQTQQASIHWDLKFHIQQKKNNKKETLNEYQAPQRVPLSPLTLFTMPLFTIRKKMIMPLAPMTFKISETILTSVQEETKLCNGILNGA